MDAQSEKNYTSPESWTEENNNENGGITVPAVNLGIRRKTTTLINHEAGSYCEFAKENEDSELEIAATSRSLGLYPVAKSYDNILHDEGELNKHSDSEE